MRAGITFATLPLAMSAPAVAVLSDLAEGLVDAALERDDEGGMRSFDAALERYRDADALSPWRAHHVATRAERAALAVLVRLGRDLLEGARDR